MARNPCVIAASQRLTVERLQECLRMAELAQALFYLGLLSREETNRHFDLVRQVIRNRADFLRARITAFDHQARATQDHSALLTRRVRALRMELEAQAVVEAGNGAGNEVEREEVATEALSEAEAETRAEAGAGADRRDEEINPAAEAGGRPASGV